MDPLPIDPTPANPFESLVSVGWNIRIPKPEESEYLLRHEPRISVDEFIAEMERKYDLANRDG